MKKITLFSLLAMMISLSGISQTYSTGTVSLSPSINFTVQFDIDTTNDEVTLTMVGDSDVWLGVAPGVDSGNGMGNSGDDVIIFSNFGLEDRNMTGNTVQPNLDGQQDWTVISNNVSNNLRTIIAIRDITTGDSNDYLFPESETSFPLLWAYGNNTLNLSYHGSGRGGTVANTTLGNDSFEVNEVSFDLYPNPTSGELNISFSSNYIIENSDLEIYDVLGKRVYTQSVSDFETKVNVRNLESGMYLIKIKNANGAHTKRFIKN